jgi:hypothetical protein
MSEFGYTHFHSFGWEDSDFVRALYFNSETRELLVELAGEKLYKYAGFTAVKFKAFAEAGSPGTHYNTLVKKSHYVTSHGFFGYRNEVTFTDLEVGKKATRQYEVTTQVTVTVTVKVTADSFDSAAALGVAEINKVQGFDADVLVTGVKKL